MSMNVFDVALHGKNISLRDFSGRVDSRGDGAGGDGGGTSSLIAAGMLFGGMGPFGGPGQGAPAPAAPAGDDVLDRLERLQKLWDDGVLSDEEFESQKRRILGS